MRLLTAIPVFNEEVSLVGVLTEVLKYASDVLVVDDGSSDRTPVLLRDFPTVRTIRHPRNLGYGSEAPACFPGNDRQPGYDGVVTLDCDGQHEPARAFPEESPRIWWRQISSLAAGTRIFDPNQKPPEQRRRINVEVTRQLQRMSGNAAYRCVLRLQGLSNVRAAAVRHYRRGIRDASGAVGAGGRP